MIRSVYIALAMGLGLAANNGAAAATARVDAAWLRTAPKGAAVMAGYATVTNLGGEIDHLVGARIPLIGTADVHSMSMTSGVMRMRRLDGGLALAPGATVTLRPGGDHLMFPAPAAPLAPGRALAGSLQFEKAGTVPVTFTIAPAGATAPPVPAAPQQGR